MQKYSDIVLFNGQPLIGASVTVLNYPAGSNATVYIDNGITTGPNPITTDINGRYSFYVANGRYSLQIAYPNAVTQTILDFPLEDDPANGQTVVISGGSINNTPIGGTTPSTGEFTLETLVPQPAPASPVAGNVWEDSAQNTLTAFEAGLKVWKSGPIFIGTAQAVTSGTAASSWIPTGVGTLTIPANFLVTGKTLRLGVRGTMASAAAPGTTTLSVSLGASNLWTSGAQTPTASLSQSFYLDVIITCRTTGATGSVNVCGQLTYDTGSGTLPPATLVSLSSFNTAMNTTIANALAITTTNSIASGTVWTINTFLAEMIA